MAKPTEPEALLELFQDNPQEALRLLSALRDKVRYPHPGQQLVLDSKARFRVINAGRRFGKTILAAKILLQQSRKPDKMLWWVAPTYKVVKRGYAEVLRQLPDGVLDGTPPPDTHFDAGRSVSLRFKNGTRMEFYSAERPEGMLGAAVDFAVLDEAAIMKSSIWNQIVSPTLMDHEGGALLISTPRGRNWFYRVWQKGQDKQDKLYDSWTFATQDNPTLPPGEADRMAADMPRLEADQEIYAKWIASGSNTFVVPAKSVEYNAVLDNGFVEETPPKGFVVMGVDLAKTNDWTVLYGVNARTRRNCYYERFNAVTWPEQKRRIRAAVRRLLKNGATGVMLVMDSTGVGDPIVDDLEAQGYDVVGINFNTHKTNMVKLLAKDLEETRAFVLDERLNEFEDYTMIITEGGRIKYSAPEGEHDDVVSAKMLSHWGCVNEGVPEVQLISGDQADIEDDPYGGRGDDDEGESWDDLIDNDEPTDAELAEAIGYHVGRPTVRDLLTREELWH
jgi:hypothetical protein